MEYNILIWSSLLFLAAIANPIVEFCIKKKKIRQGTLLLISIFIAVGTFWKGCEEHDMNVKLINKSDTIRYALDTINLYQKKSAESLDKIEELSNYVNKIEALGIIRDTNTNAPIITRTINSQINSQSNVSSYNQKGGQTAGNITNNH